MATSSSPPEAREPLSPSGPPAGRKFPCAKCGAKLDFDPRSRALQCPYCGYTQAIEPSAARIEKHDLEAQLQQGTAGVVPGRSSQVTCTACNAVVLLEDNVATDRCPYCGTHLENQPQAAEAMIQPEGILPFAVTYRQAVDGFGRWLASLWFAPNALKSVAELGQLNGVYVPFWTFDSMTYTHYRGERGTDYTETEHYTETNAEGQTVNKTRQVTKTRWTNVSGEVQHFFEDILVCASRGVPETYSRSLQPQGLKELEGFRPEFLSGFKTERYTIGPGDGFEVAKGVMDVPIRQLCCRDIGGDHQRLSSVNTQHVGVTYRHILLPLWLATYRFRDQVFHILVNGRTGEIQGERPYSWAKIAVLVAIIAAVVLALLLFFSATARGGEERQQPALTQNAQLLAPGSRSQVEEGIHGQLRPMSVLWTPAVAASRVGRGLRGLSPVRQVLSRGRRRRRRARPAKD
jgi:DNA-directed RNA polymerase subunit RPC12/RpoP